MFVLVASTQVVFFMESMMEHVAKELKLTPEQVRKVNLYQNGQVRLRLSVVIANKRREIKQSFFKQLRNLFIGEKLEETAVFKGKIFSRLGK